MIKINSRDIHEFMQESEDNTNCYRNNPIFNRVCRVLNEGLTEPQLLGVIKGICETITEMQNKEIQTILSSKVNGLKLWATEFVELGSQMTGDKWPNKVTYTVYRNEKIEELPLLIVEQMRDYMQEVIDERVLLNEQNNNKGHLPR